MSTPVLTKQQQRHTLSAKKTQSKGLRNVLAQPQDSYWPIVSTHKCQILEEILNRLMPTMKRSSHSIPWSQLRHMKKEERTQAKKESISKEPDIQIRNSIILGINAITRSLEKDSVCCVLMDASIEPQLLIRHIIQMAQNSKVPLLLLPQLKSVTLNTIGFACAACALKNIVRESQSHYFYPLYQAIHDIFKDIPLQKKTFQLFEQITSSKEIESCETSNIPNETASKVEPSKLIKCTVSTDVYLYRASRRERKFVPPTIAEHSANEPSIETIDTKDFISVSTDDVDEYCVPVNKRSRYIDICNNKQSIKRKRQITVNQDVNSTENVTYLPLKVKRIQGNPNRVKATKMSKQKKKNE